MAKRAERNDEKRAGALPHTLPFANVMQLDAHAWLGRRTREAGQLGNGIHIALLRRSATAGASDAHA